MLTRLLLDLCSYSSSTGGTFNARTVDTILASKFDLRNVGNGKSLETLAYNIRHMEADEQEIMSRTYTKNRIFR